MIAGFGEQGPLWENFPHNLEAGTPPVSGALALAASCEYMIRIGKTAIQKHEQKLTNMLAAGLQDISGVIVLGPKEFRGSIVSFYCEEVHAYDLAKFLDSAGIAGRSGTHCAIPLYKSLGLKGSYRLSPAFYNTEEEIETTVKECRKMLGILKEFR